MTTTGLDRHYAFRDELVGRLERDVVGPGGKDETISDPPITKYAAGILFPQSQDAVGDESPPEEEPEGHHSGETVDPAVTMANVRYPSSMGLTFAVDTSLSDEIEIEVEAARYTLEQSSEGRRGRTGAVAEELWRRHNLVIEKRTLLLRPGAEPSPGSEPADGLDLYCLVRPPDQHGVTAVTVALLNRNRVGPTERRDEHAFLQPRITVRAVEGRKSPFVERPSPNATGADEELESYRLLYRHAPTFAVGHGCAVEWEQHTFPINDLTGAAGTSWIRTTFVPEYDLRLTDSNPAIDTRRLRMDYLANTASDAEIVSVLRDLTNGYRQWIRERRDQTSEPAEPSLRAVATEHLDKCTTACDRMDAGIDLLAEPGDRTTMEAFRLANRTMATQRARTDWLRSEDRSSRTPDEESPSWRPFQIAFILLSLCGVADREHEDRDIADVLWFPTGGGKTEAYLGLIAFATFLRRLRDPAHGGGVTVLMRYTLRLLTVQQFERAALLMCCMERLRRNAPDRLGRTEISIGMWVGRGSTPNSLKEAKASLNKLRRGEQVQEENPVQLRSCSWCGNALDHGSYRVEEDRLVISCGVPVCEFADGLPVHVVDDTIYAARPTLIIATADKFAGLPWKPVIGSLFNYETSDPPPELIIQDELHLISGPLGTLAGLYETTVDVLGDRPKIVASTATIRRAVHQGRALFDRSVEQFPPPGLDARDSYFSVETPPSDKGDRRYVGLMAPATSQTSLLVRAYAALLHHAQAIDGDNEVRDAYWTLLGYFNSLRLLAGARLQVQDDVNDRLDLLSRTLNQPRREIGRDIELTSREPSSAIPGHLQDMETPYPDALGVILATNMISVGVDVNRLGLMVVMGQPQSTSEYIQATSRVGRKWPGLVVTLFNSGRSRDRSHYESFTSYHSALYRQVEATSVTPFSARARDRGLHATVVALARLLIPRARPAEAAAAIADFDDELRAVCDRVLNRVARVAGEDERDATEHQIDEIIQQWRRLAREKPNLGYGNYRSPGLLIDAGRWDESDDEVGDLFPTLWSLRDVDVESTVYLDRGKR
ncbi:helicase-related protein [Streptomonospora wellingtoniae]|uniref:Helicase-related protein n=1 Tax=Streptomonospora wellingtoniae TaxID=3075544 RepID=A0ABU2KN75_9ACTN|nr:helicase-related protein [Streptomonospora sp. DSM 45055]MDT0300715.1 helicase-related protein [Streptomonospora sp. DSM 45055]